MQRVHTRYAGRGHANLKRAEAANSPTVACLVVVVVGVNRLPGVMDDADSRWLAEDMGILAVAGDEDPKIGWLLLDDLAVGSDRGDQHRLGT